MHVPELLEDDPEDDEDPVAVEAELEVVAEPAEPEPDELPLLEPVAVAAGALVAVAKTPPASVEDEAGAEALVAALLALLVAAALVAALAAALLLLSLEELLSLAL